MLHIFNLPIFLNPVYPVTDSNTVSIIRNSRISQFIHQITTVILYFNCVLTFPGRYFHSGYSRMDLSCLCIVNSIITHHITIHLLGNQFLYITSRPHAEQFITKSFLCL